MTERHVCRAAIVKGGGGKEKKREKKKTCLKLLKILRHGCAELVSRANNTFFLAERTRLGTIVSLSRGGYILLVYTCTQS